MGKSAPAPPAPPDPVKTAAAQGVINRETAISQANLNRTDEYTPYGSSTWTQEAAKAPTNTPVWESVPIYGEEGGWEYDDEGESYYTEPVITGYKKVNTNLNSDPQDPTERRWTRTTTLDPAQQAIVDKQNAVTKSLNEVAVSQVGRVSNALATPFSYDGMPDAGSTAGAAAAANRSAQLAGRELDYSGLVDAPSAQGINSAADAAARSVSTPFNMSGSAPTGAKVSAAADRAQSSVSQPFNYNDLSAAASASGITNNANRIGDIGSEQFNYNNLSGAADAGNISTAADMARASASQTPMGRRLTIPAPPQPQKPTQRLGNRLLIRFTSSKRLALILDLRVSNGQWKPNSPIRELFEAAKRFLALWTIFIEARMTPIKAHKMRQSKPVVQNNLAFSG